MSITDISYVKEIARMLQENNLTRLDISDGGARVVVEKEQTAGAAVTRIVESPVPAAVSGESLSTDTENKDIINFNNVFEVKAPLVGVFYSAPSPDDEPFVRIGDEVQKGDVLCIIEAMKLLNEISAERDGRVVDICVKNGDIAEYGQVLFKLG